MTSGPRFTDFDAALAHARGIQVDVEHLRNLAEHLVDLTEAVAPLRKEVDEAHRTTFKGGNVERSGLGSNIDVARDIGRRLTSMHTVTDKNLRAMTVCLAQSAKAVLDISKKYQTVEARNRVAAAEVDKLLHTGEEKVHSGTSQPHVGRNR